MGHTVSTVLFWLLMPCLLGGNLSLFLLQALSSLEQGAHGVMVGRAWTTKPWYWSQADSRLFGTKVNPDGRAPLGIDFTILGRLSADPGIG